MKSKRLNSFLMLVWYTSKQSDSQIHVCILCKTSFIRQSSEIVQRKLKKLYNIQLIMSKFKKVQHLFYLYTIL